MKYLHTMVRVTDIEQSLRFYRDALGLREVSRTEFPKGRFTLVFLAAPGDEEAQVELTHNWDPEPYPVGRKLRAPGLCRRRHLCVLSAPDGPRRHHQPAAPATATWRSSASPDNISIELLQKGAALAPAEPWATMPNMGQW